MKKYLLPSLLTLAAWTGFAHGQASLGMPVTNGGPCESCNHAPAAAAPCSDGRSRLCQSGFGQLARSMLAPIRLATGNLLPNCCVEVVTKEDVARMIADGCYSQTEIAAAKIKVDEAQAHARRAAVRYLATVDCHYYPEAEVGLIAALRADRCECVRLEAALALGSNHCLTSRIVDALCITALGSETDGNPAESSARVRFAAQAVLNRCLALGAPLPSGPLQVLPAPDWSAPPPMPAPTEPPMLVQPTNYYGALPADSASPSLLYERSQAEKISANPKTTSLPTGKRTLFDLFMSSANHEPAPVSHQEASPPRPAPPRSPAPPPLGLTPIGSQVSIPNSGS